MRWWKRDIQTAVARRLTGLIAAAHVRSVIAILIEEVVRDLQEGRPVRIQNLGTFELIDIGSRTVMGFGGAAVQTKPSRVLRLRLSRGFHRWLKDS